MTKHLQVRRLGGQLVGTMYRFSRSNGA